MLTKVFFRNSRMNNQVPGTIYVLIFIKRRIIVLASGDAAENNKNGGVNCRSVIRRRRY